MKILYFVPLIGAQCPFDGFDGESHKFNYVACRLEGAKLSTASALGHFKTREDFDKFPAGAPEGTQCIKLRCRRDPARFGAERVGCYEGRWFPLQFVPRIGFVPQFGTSVTHPQCDDQKL